MKVTITDGTMTLDGGSIFLKAIDSSAASLTFRVDWSIDAQLAGAMQFYVDGVAVPRNSEPEAQWLALLREAEIEIPDGGRPAEASPKPAMVLSDDIAAYMDAIDHGPTEALAWLVRDFVSKVSSEAYQRSLPTMSKS